MTCDVPSSGKPNCFEFFTYKTELISSVPWRSNGEINISIGSCKQTLSREENQSHGLWGLTPGFEGSSALSFLTVPYRHPLLASQISTDWHLCNHIWLWEILKNSRILYFSVNSWTMMFVYSSDQHLNLSPLHLPTFLLSFCLSSFPISLSPPLYSPH